MNTQPTPQEEGKAPQKPKMVTSEKVTDTVAAKNINTIQRKTEADVSNLDASKYDTASEMTAQYIGSESITPQRVKEVILEANKKGLVFHGMKFQKEYENLLKNGVENRTPEGGNLSYWATGRNLFNNGGTGSFATYNTSFFHYAPAMDAPKDRYSMVIVITDKNKLKEKNVKGADEIPMDKEITISDVVPADAICVLRVTAHKDPPHSSRKDAQRVEQEMFRLIEKVVHEGLKPGTVIDIDLDKNKN